MATVEKRKFPRIESSNFCYIHLNENDRVLSHGTGKTINVSEGGLLIETDLELKKDHGIVAVIKLEDDEIELQGKVVYCQSKGDNKYFAGIQLTGMAAGGKPFWKNFIDRIFMR